MSVSVKNKVWLGTVFLFLMLLLIGGVCIYYLVKIRNNAKAVLQDNYASIKYCHAMQKQLDSINIAYAQSIKKFEAELLQQENNITEPGEQEATSALRNYFESLKSEDTAKHSLKEIKQQLEHIIRINMGAIQQKKKDADDTADYAFAYISIVASLVLLVAFTFLLNFPLVVTGPIYKLMEGIREIANKNYSHRIYIFNKDEFGQLATAFNQMAERLEYFESRNLSKLLFEKSRAEAVINSLKDASIGIDKNNIILFANHQILQLLNVSAVEVVGETVEELTAKSDLFGYLIKHESLTPFKIVVDNKENYYVREVIEVSHGETNSKVIVIKNITSFKELDVAKTNFISTISHELKTPIASSDFSLKLLEDERTGKLSKDQQELIHHVKDDNRRMLNILSDLLDMSQVETGNIRLNIEEVNPDSIVDETIETVLSSAKEKKITIHKNIEENLGLIKADAEKTSWVLNNFLTNAIKYSAEGSTITISVNQRRKDIVFSVTDQGPGIESEYLRKVFERYFKVPGSKPKGTGLGLAISKEFIEIQHGKIWAESEVGKGCSFKFCLAKSCY